MGNSWLGIDTPTLWGWTPIDRATWALSELMFEGTQRGLLQFLFGATALIMTGAAMGRPGPAAPASTYFRRNLLLMAFGAVDFTLLLWPGDILFDYGLAGLLLFPMRRLRPRTLILAGAGLLVLISAIPLPFYFDDVALQSRAEAGARLPEAARTAEDRRAIQEWREARAPVDLHRVEAERRFRLGGYADNFDFSVRRSARVRGSPAYPIFILESLGTMMIGMALFKTGVLQGRRSRRFYAIMLAGGYGAGWAVNAAEIYFHLATNFAPTPLFYVTYELGRVPIILGHVALIHLVLSTGLGGRLLSAFAAPGRMALTCYVAQTLICCWLLFPGFGLGLYGAFGQAELAGIAAAIGLGQLIACRLWLRRFGAGPLEAVLRKYSGRGRGRFAAMA